MYVFTPRWSPSRDLNTYQSQRVLWASSEWNQVDYWFLIHSLTPPLKREAHFSSVVFSPSRNVGGYTCVAFSEFVVSCKTMSLCHRLNPRVGSLRANIRSISIGVRPFISGTVNHTMVIATATKPISTNPVLARRFPLSEL